MKLNTDHLYQPRNGYKPNDLVIFDGQPCRIAMLSEGGVHLTQGPDWSTFGPMDIGYDEIRHAELVPAGPDHWCIESAPEPTLHESLAPWRENAARLNNEARAQLPAPTEYTPLTLTINGRIQELLEYAHNQNGAEGVELLRRQLSLWAAPSSLELVREVALTNHRETLRLEWKHTCARCSNTWTAMGKPEAIEFCTGDCAEDYAAGAQPGVDCPVDPSICEGEHCPECNTCGSDTCATCRASDEERAALDRLLQSERDSERPMRMGL